MMDRYAVLLPWVKTEDGDALLLEVRSLKVKQPGEVCFPGGKTEPGETITEAAVRETCEELGLKPRDIEVISELEPLIMGDGREVHPVTARVHIDDIDALRLSGDEVAEVFLLPVKWLCEHEIKHYYELGRREMGIEHVILPDNGIVLPGDLVIGADSHTCTYGALGSFSTGVGSTDLACAMARGVTWFKVPEAIKVNLTGVFDKFVTGKDLILHIIGKIGVDGALYKSLEFVGDGIKALSMDQRLTVCNMVIECGAKNGIFPVDNYTLKYISKTNPDRFIRSDYKVFEADENAVYSQVIDIDLSEIPLTVALPHLPSNTRKASECKDMKIDQVVIGSCTNGRLEDIGAAAMIFKGLKVHKDVRCIVIPGSQRVYRQALEMGWLEILDDAGCVISTPTCGPCLGGHMGVLAKGERCVSTTNRNFVGRMGDVGSEVILSGVPVAAASAILGRVGTPDEL